jgi:hypothetical protein
LTANCDGHRVNALDILDEEGEPKLRGLELSQYIKQISEEISSRVIQERDVLLKHLEDDPGNGEPISYCSLVDCAPRKKYRTVLSDAVRVLEETRRSFKSRQLEELRKKLQAVLADDAD